jgi:pimeloyl-ACP methyl ester carboxylesterase
VDLPGLGDSHGTPPSYDKKTLARYVHRLVADTLGHRRVHLVGHDFGARVALACAAFQQESAASLTVMDFQVRWSAGAARTGSVDSGEGSGAERGRS